VQARDAGHDQPVSLVGSRWPFMRPFQITLVYLTYYLAQCILFVFYLA